MPLGLGRNFNRKGATLGNTASTVPALNSAVEIADAARSVARPEQPNPPIAQKTLPATALEQPDPEALQTAAPQNRFEQLGVPQFDQDPLGAIGFILQSVAAGIEGDESPLERLEKRHLQQQQLDMASADFLLNGIGKAQEIAKNFPEDKKEEGLNVLSDAFKKVAPGFDLKSFIGKAGKTDIAALIPELEQLNPTAKRLVMKSIEAKGGSAEDAIEIMSDKTFMDRMFQINDLENRERIVPKIQEWNAILQREGLRIDQVPEITFSEFEQINNKAPEALRLDASELATVRRDPDLQRALQIRSEEDLTTEDKERTKSRFDKTKEPKSDLVDEQGNVKTETSSGIHRQVASLFGGTYNPATGQISGLDKESSSRALAIAAEAENLVQNGEASSIGNAARIAAERFGVQFPGSTAPGGQGAAGGGQAGAGNIPDRAIQFLKENNTPENRQFFDEKYGNGAASRVLGS